MLAARGKFLNISLMASKEKHQKKTLTLHLCFVSKVLPGEPSREEPPPLLQCNSLNTVSGNPRARCQSPNPLLYPTAGREGRATRVWKL